MANHWPLTVALIQSDPTTGCCLPNAISLAKRCKAARERGADLAIAPMMALCGYPLEGLADKARGFHMQAEEAIDRFAHLIPQDFSVLLGHGRFIGGQFIECIYWVTRGKATPIAYRVPSNQGAAAAGLATVTISDCRIAVCFSDTLPTQASGEAVDLVVVCDASAYEITIHAKRLSRMSALSALFERPVVYVNLVGGQDDWLFDGKSFAVDPKGEVCAQLPPFIETMAYLSLKNRQISSSLPINAGVATAATDWPVAECYAAVVFGVKEFARKNDFDSVILGLSGGLDSALVAAIAVDALGSDRVTAVMMPSPFTSETSIEDARALAINLGIRYLETPIDALFKDFRTVVDDLIGEADFGITEENLQARIRAVILMAISNRTRALLLTTSNKSEVAVGYSTLYGDTAGGFAPLKDLYKTRVYQMARYRNELSPIIVDRIIERPPSAELRENQTDADSLPPYETLDAILTAYIDRGELLDEIVAQGFDRAVVERISDLIVKSCFKRRQFPPGVRLSDTYFFGRLPIATYFCDADGGQSSHGGYLKR